jgi:hypothetical protein
VGTSRLLSCGGGNDSLDGVLHNVPELEGLDQIAKRQRCSSSSLGDDIRVPDHTPVFDSNLVVRLVNVVHLLDTLIQRRLCSEDGGIGLHSLLHVASDSSGRQGSRRVPDFVELLDRLSSKVVLHGLVWCTRGQVLLDVVGACSTENDNVEQRVGSESVGSVDRDTGGFTSSVKTWNDLVFSLFVDSEDLSSVLGRDTSHATLSARSLVQAGGNSLVVDGRQDGDGLLGDIDTGKDGGGLGNTGQSLV